MNLMKNGILKYYWIVKVVLGVQLIYYASFYPVSFARFLVMWCGVLQILLGFLWRRIDKKGEGEK